MARMILVALVTASLAACQAEERAPVPPADTAQQTESASSPTPKEGVREEVRPMPRSTENEADGCGADKVGQWLNALPTADVKAEIARAVGERPIRYYTQGDAITMDFVPARLNVELGADGRIKLFRCG